MPAPQGHKREGDGTPIYEADHHHTREQDPVHLKSLNQYWSSVLELILQLLLL